MTVLNANEIGYYDLNKKIVECDDNDITITDAMGQRYICLLYTSDAADE